MSVDLEYNYEEAVKALDFFSENHMSELRQWTQKSGISKTVPKDLSNKQIVLFYNACYGDVEKTKVCLEKYYNCRKNAPEFFNNRVMQTPELVQATETLEFYILPEKTKEGYDIIFHRLHDNNPSKFCQESSYKLLFMTIDLCLSKRGPQPGYVFLYDMQRLKFGHLTRINISGLRKVFEYMQEALPIRMQSVHVLNTGYLNEKMMLIVKPFIEKKFYDMITLHNKNAGLEKLYEIVPRSSLPSDYGGTLADSQTLHKQCMDQLRSREPYFKAEEEQRLAAILGENEKHL